MTEAITIYTVRRWPVTAAAKSSAGYDPREYEYVAENATAAVSKAVSECEWRDAARNFRFQAVSSRVVVLGAVHADGGRG